MLLAGVESGRCGAGVSSLSAKALIAARLARLVGGLSRWYVVQGITGNALRVTGASRLALRWPPSLLANTGGRRHLTGRGSPLARSLVGAVVRAGFGGPLVPAALMVTFLAARVCLL